MSSHSDLIWSHFNLKKRPLGALGGRGPERVKAESLALGPGLLAARLFAGLERCR